jgi:carboxy-terminal domain RNA polymerase II polypeptide A small phosphatase
MSELPSNPMDDLSPPPPVDVPANDAPAAAHKRKPSRQGVPQEAESVATPSQPDDEKGNGHAPGDGGGQPEGEQQAVEAMQQPPSAGAPDTPVELAPSPNPSFEKPTEASSTNATKPARPEFTEKPAAAISKPKASRPKKPSFWSRLFHALVPCAGPSSAHVTRLDMDSTSATPLREKQRDERKDKAQEASTSTGHTQTHTADPSTTATLAPAVLTLPSQPLPPITPPTPTQISDPAVIVPPSPKSHRLPKEVTAGVTSGAVQPPGSTGVEDPEERERDSEQSESSSFTDEEEHERGVLSPNVGAGAGPGLHEEDLEDEEDRLIMSGGVGIPIGPVSLLFLHGYSGSLDPAYLYTRLYRRLCCEM